VERERKKKKRGEDCGKRREDHHALN